MILARFRKIIWENYRKNGREFAWRETRDTYKIVVSEVMLQQTQTSRVKVKYPAFVKKFPDFKTLAQASTAEVLRAWQGLGYNRRALYLKKLAEQVVKDFEGKLPREPKILQTLPGIGAATAGSIAAFAFNSPTVFIETNIRAVFLHFFFAGKNKVSDQEILPLVEKSLDRANPREWYYALMDYGVKLKSEIENPSRRSKHHARQSKFKGSNREKRGAIIRLLSAETHTLSLLSKKLTLPTTATKTLVTELAREGLVITKKQQVFLAK